MLSPFPVTCVGLVITAVLKKRATKVSLVPFALESLKIQVGNTPICCALVIFSITLKSACLSSLVCAYCKKNLLLFQCVEITVAPV